MPKITIDVSDDMYTQLMEISEGLNSQDNRCTASPYYYTIVQTKELPTSADYSNRSFFINGDGNELEYDFYKKGDFHRYLSDDGYEQETIEEYLEKYDEESYDINEWLDDEFGIRKIYVLTEDYQSNVFLTERAAKEYLKNDAHNLEKGAYDYLEYANKNPELNTVINFLKLLK